MTSAQISLIRSTALSLLESLNVSKDAASRAVAAVEISWDAPTAAFLGGFEAAGPFRVWETAAAVNVAISAAISLLVEKRLAANAVGQPSPASPRMVVNPAHATLSLVSHHLGTIDGESFEATMARIVKAGGYGSVLTGFHEFRGRHMYLHKSMSARQTLDALGFTKKEQGLFRDLDLKDKDAARKMLTEKIKATGWTAQEAEEKLWANGACASMVRTHEEFLETEQGKVLSKLPTFVVDSLPVAAAARETSNHAAFDPTRPLKGLKVLDLSRILAGPVASKLLASLGAEVLKISSPNVPDMDSFVIGTSLGKRATFLDLKSPGDRATFFEKILPETDVVIQGFRQDALGRIGLDFASLSAKINTLIASGARPASRPLYYLSENCYGPHGPLAHLGGWEQIAQAFTGLMLPNSVSDAPRMLPYTLLDILTGHTVALSLLGSLLQPTPMHTYARTSLVQSAMLAQSLGRIPYTPVPHDATKDIGALSEDLLATLSVQPLLDANPEWMGHHPRSPRGDVRFLRPAFGMKTGNGVFYGRYTWSTRKNGHDAAEWVGERQGDGDTEDSVARL